MIVIDRESCIGCGLCAENIPQLFRINNGKAEIKQIEIPETIIQAVKDIIEDCPAGAISF